MRRLVAILLLIAALTPVLWLRAEVRPVEVTQFKLAFAPIPLSAENDGSDGALGPFVLERAWVLESGYRDFGGYSALVALGEGQLLAVSDAGWVLRFSAPDAAAPVAASTALLLPDQQNKMNRDVEAATADLAANKVWLALEFENMVMRFDLRDGRLSPDRNVRPPGMKDWGSNAGPESLERLQDGHFLALREGFSSWFDRRSHRGLLFAADPVAQPKAQAFTFVGPWGFSPTDAAQMPDGRVLVLLRRVIWPFPVRFGGAIAIGDPADIRNGREWRVRKLAEWDSVLPNDNFEGMAVEPVRKGEEGGPLTVWLISDDNRAEMQRTVLWKLRLDPARVPDSRKKARGSSARLMQK